MWRVRADIPDGIHQLLAPVPRLFKLCPHRILVPGGRVRPEPQLLEPRQHALILLRLQTGSGPLAIDTLVRQPQLLLPGAKLPERRLGLLDLVHGGSAFLLERDDVAFEFRCVLFCVFDTLLELLARALDAGVGSLLLAKRAAFRAGRDDALLGEAPGRGARVGVRVVLPRRRREHSLGGDELALVDGLLHLLHQTLLSLDELAVTCLHAANLFLHRAHDIPAHVRVQRRLRLLLELDLTFPEHDLALRLDNLGDDPFLLLCSSLDLRLERHSLNLEVLQLADDLSLQDVVVGDERVVEFGVFVPQSVDADHVLMHSLHGFSELAAFVFLSVQVLVQPVAPRGEQRLLLLQPLGLLRELVVLVDRGHELRLPVHPTPLELLVLLLLLFNLLVHVLHRSLHRAQILAVVIPAGQRLELLVQAIHVPRALRDVVVASLDLSLVLVHRPALLRELRVQHHESLVKRRQRSLRVQDIHARLRNLVLQRRDVHLLVPNLPPDLPRGVDGPLHPFLHGGLFGEVGQHSLVVLAGFRRRLRNLLLRLVRLVVQRLSLPVRLLEVRFRLLE